jgi:hypothetical protein
LPPEIIRIGQEAEELIAESRDRIAESSAFVKASLNAVRRMRKPCESQQAGWFVE